MCICVCVVCACAYLWGCERWAGSSLGLSHWTLILEKLGPDCMLSVLNGKTWVQQLMAGGLTELSLSGTALGPDGAAALGAFLPRSAATLTSLDLRCAVEAEAVMYAAQNLMLAYNILHLYFLFECTPYCEARYYLYYCWYFQVSRYIEHHQFRSLRQEMWPWRGGWISNCCWSFKSDGTHHLQPLVSW